MAKATKSHREKKNHRSFELWSERKRDINANDGNAVRFQRLYRINCLKQRAAENRLTDKNRAEAGRLGVAV